MNGEDKMLNSNSRILAGREYCFYEAELLQSELLFYPENPRVYSLLNATGGIPDQEEIQKIMIKFDHVKELKKSIVYNNGLIEPLIVREGDYVVLEGNSRLAAYRLLAEGDDPIKWAHVKCQVFPADISEEAIFALLGQFHVSGKTNWSPYEQGGFLVRQVRSTGKDVVSIAKVLGMKPREAERFVETYEFMEEHEDLTPSRWSYYYEYLGKRAIKKFRDTDPSLDQTFVNDVKRGAIRKAEDVRDVLDKVAKNSSKEAKKIMRSYIAGAIDIYEGLEHLEESGKTGDSYSKLHRFSETICDEHFEKKVAGGNRALIEIELKRIRKRVDQLLEKLKD